MCCLSDPKVEQILRDQATRVNAIFHPRTFFMSHDEIRFANWCRTCQDRKLTPGQMLADNVRVCVEILKKTNSRARIVVWSDMFDPYHNAVDRYYLVNGTLKGSWEGLPRDVIIANWNSGKARDSLGWFARQGHRQIIAGYYDSDDLAASRPGSPRPTGSMACSASCTPPGKPGSACSSGTESNSRRCNERTPVDEAFRPSTRRSSLILWLFSVASPHHRP